MNEKVPVTEEEELSGIAGLYRYSRFIEIPENGRVASSILTGPKIEEKN